MTNPLGIQLRSLRLRGQERSDARIDFAPGLNVISGVSDTGKSYILKCIDFLFGASEKPKDIDEAAGYEQVYLECVDREGVAFTISRSLVDKTIRKYDVRLDAIQDQAGESFEKDGGAGGQLSPFLLGKCGLEAVDVVKNARGESQRFSFRAIANWLCVDEETIIAERSPILSTQRTSESYNANGFDYLITGHTSTVDEVEEKPEITKARLEAQQNLFDQLVASLDEQITRLASQAPNATVASLDIRELEETLRSQSNALKQAQAELQRHHSRLRSVRAEHADIVIALERLRLLQSAYAADLSRLDFVLDGGHFFEQLQDVACPLCQRTGEPSQESEHLQDNALAESCHAEKATVTRKSEELRQTVETLVEREQELSSTLQSTRSQIHSVEERINAELRPSLDSVQADIDQAIASASVLARQNELTQRRDYLIEQKVALDSPSTQEKPERNSLVGIDSRAMQGVCDCIHGVLERWQFPKLGTVAFDPTTTVRDITIGGKKRSDYGKGYRAVTKAAFWVGVMEYCAKNTRAFPYFLILDSPLLNVKQHTEGENVRDEVKQAFFEDLSRLSEDRQVIVLENVEPPENVRQQCKFTLYKKDPETGLGGFLPTKEQ